MNTATATPSRSHHAGHASEIPSEFLPCQRPPRRRTDKIASLPTEVQESLNRLIASGVPYREILRQLGPHGQTLNIMNLSRWYAGGHQDYLQKLAGIDRTRLQSELAAQMIKESGSMDASKIYEACRVLSSVQMFTALKNHGKESLSHAMTHEPGSFFRLTNTVCRATSATMANLKSRIAQPEIEESPLAHPMGEGKGEGSSCVAGTASSQEPIPNSRVFKGNIAL